MQMAPFGRVLDPRSYEPLMACTLNAAGLTA